MSINNKGEEDYTVILARCNDPRVLLGCNRGSAVVIVLVDIIGKVGYKQWVKLY